MLTFSVDVALFSTRTFGNAYSFEQALHITSNYKVFSRNVISIHFEDFGRFYGRQPRVLLLRHKQLKQIYQLIYQFRYYRMFVLKYINSWKLFIIKYIDVPLAQRSLDHSLSTFLSISGFKPINWQCQAWKDSSTRVRTPLQVFDG